MVRCTPTRALFQMFALAGTCGAASGARCGAEWSSTARSSYIKCRLVSISRQLLFFPHSPTPTVWTIQFLIQSPSKKGFARRATTLLSCRRCS
ncbi:hypothetical protein B0H19DRAFT_238986 [Mycena capillaripes]|nr:hypothetical protein B0H19DRAFT_238986 [Mycena capillaripes]